VAEEKDDDGEMTIAEEWRASLVGLQFQFQKQMLSMLLDKGVLDSADVRLMMFDLAERLRHGSDQVGTQEIAYYFAGLVEELGNELAVRGQRAADAS
jgi:hypothetical protein